MELNFLVFPAPKRNWKADILGKYLIWVPVNENSHSYNMIPREVQLRFKVFEAQKGKISIKKDSIADKITLKGRKVTTTSVTGCNRRQGRIAGGIKKNGNHMKEEIKSKMKYSLPDNSGLQKKLIFGEDSSCLMDEYLRGEIDHIIPNNWRMKSMEDRAYVTIQEQQKSKFEEVDSFSSINLNQKMANFMEKKTLRVSVAGKKNLESLNENSWLILEESEIDRISAKTNMCKLGIGDIIRQKKVGAPRQSTGRTFMEQMTSDGDRSNKNENLFKKRGNGGRIGRMRSRNKKGGNQDGLRLNKKKMISVSPMRYMKNSIGGDTFLQLSGSHQLDLLEMAQKQKTYFHNNPLSNMKKSVYDSFAAEAGLETSSQMFKFNGVQESVSRKIGGHKDNIGGKKTIGGIKKQFQPQIPLKIKMEYIDDESGIGSRFNSMMISEDPSACKMPTEPNKGVIKKTFNWNLKKIDMSTTAGLRSDASSQKYSAGVLRSIPCVYIPSRKLLNESKNKILIHFHGNAEDLRGIFPFLHMIHDSLKISILGVEYPGYGLYNGESSEKTILEDSEAVIQHVIQEMGYPPNRIILSGRSMGSGPSIHLASKYKVETLILISPFLSIKGVVTNLLGRMAAMLLKERFNNEEKIKNIRCPLLIVHSKEDTLVPFDHSLKLKKNARTICTIIDDVLDSHRMTDIQRQYIQPVLNFLKLVNLKNNSK